MPHKIKIITVKIVEIITRGLFFKKTAFFDIEFLSFKILGHMSIS